MMTSAIAAALAIAVMTEIVLVMSRGVWRSGLSRERSFAAVLLAAALPWGAALLVVNYILWPLPDKPVVEVAALVAPVVLSSLVFWRFLKISYLWGLGCAILSYVLLIICRLGLETIFRHAVRAL